MRGAAMLALALLVAGCGRGSTRTEATMDHPQRSPEALSLARVEPRSRAATLEMVSDALGADGSIDLRHTAYGNNLSPPLRWTPVEGAGAYAIILEDPDAPQEKPFVHWMIWNIPGTSDQVPEGLPNQAHLVTPQNAIQGKNDNGSSGYFGPRPPSGTGLHHYHFQIFALDGPLTVKPDADLRTLVDAMKGRVLADGELVGTYAARRGQ
ncbi:MAG TPA: YbhB/YbcL family Raf kinase inhibitor-like protein [Caulobacteraceae bacterium]|nr:YbhB/YbcL family Raf kinase inhibitor-like protein [Caulobacteraceae bacterium]